MSLVLLKWYDHNKRDLPWRTSNLFYPVYVSEVMLQQTQVKTVIPFYTKWFIRFPSIESVAVSNIDELLKLWEGLGYYSRCVNFHKSCKILFNKYDSQLPENEADFLKLPGVGNYISSAVYSIVKNLPLTAIDANIKRIMCRVLKIKYLTPYNNKRINNAVEKFIDKDRPGDFNQALMDLGSSICTPIKTDCYICPISSLCKAMKTSSPLQYPFKKPKRIKPLKRLAAAIIFNKDKFFIVKRPLNKMLGGLWELPTIELNAYISPNDQLFKYIKMTYNITVSINRKITTIKHSYSHFDILINLYKCNLQDNNLINSEFASWIKPDDIKRYAFSKSNHKLFNKLNLNAWNI